MLEGGHTKFARRPPYPSALYQPASANPFTEATTAGIPCNTAACSVHQESVLNPVGRGWLYKFWAQAFIIPGLVILLISVVTLGIILLLKHQTTASNEAIVPIDTDEQQSGSYPTESHVLVPLPEKLHIVPRREWLGKPPTEKPTPLQLPVPYVVILHSAQENCAEQATCSFLVRQVQSFHMDSRGWDDIGYSFLVGGDGYAYEGRGWKSVGAQVYGYNTKCIGITFIGTFNNVMPPERQIIAAKRLIEIGLKEGYIAKDYKLLAARQLQTTQSPGLLLYEDVKTWPHWSQTP